MHTELKAIVSLSGGMDSATLIPAIMKSFTLEAVGFVYGSKHNVYESAAASSVAAFYGLPYTLIDLSVVGRHLESDLLKTGGEIPEGHYEDQSMARTVVPGRNMIFASILAGIAWSRGAEVVYLGVHSGDHAIYPDCRPKFLVAMRSAIESATDNRVTLEAPLLLMDKGQIVKRGLKLGVPYHLTRTCYKDQPIACGKCGSCQERLQAFADAGQPDPIEYESRVIMPKA